MCIVEHKYSSASDRTMDYTGVVWITDTFTRREILYIGGDENQTIIVQVHVL